ncbi:MAG: HD-GYP domain-containing protein [Candidatus Omnitrophica bacterium]|jgi:HD-GYP domain-containing protein (c-di-GMP phosphodiesterase class II)|nr:HD-GYP domain-containing protein [Candidatus Omnitrophota bacterium]MDD3275420.1 HD-GYP domain-containing protein [Candidatus Omnitrophota bacterium]MDD5077765.1 HD-GYP domain-containing protein [Candidatus Omnitrophota bacterium]
MTIDYKKELENTARNMIFVHDPDLLIRMIARMMVEKAGISHASFFLHNRQKQGYLLKVSRGSLHKRIPLDLVCIDKDDVLIRFFRDHQSNFIFGREALLLSEAKSAVKGRRLKPAVKQRLSQVVYQMELLEVEVCVPNYFRDELLGLLFLGKKTNSRKFSDEELDFFTALNSSVAMAIRNAQLFKQLEYELDRKHQLFIRTTIALAAAIEAKDNYTHGHTNRVSSISMEIANRMKVRAKKNFDGSFLENLHVSSLLHDIGKIGVPEHILNKRGSLTVGERNRIKEHPMIGVGILKSIKELEEAVSGVRYHHERFDGQGYPEGLKGEQIPLIASIITVADSFDAMSSDRPYRTAREKGDVVNEIGQLKGKQFSPLVTDAFLELCREGRI